MENKDTITARSMAESYKIQGLEGYNISNDAWSREELTGRMKTLMIRVECMHSQLHYLLSEWQQFESILCHLDDGNYSSKKRIGKRFEDVIKKNI